MSGVPRALPSVVLASVLLMLAVLIQPPALANGEAPTSAGQWFEQYRALADTAPFGCPPVLIPKLSPADGQATAFPIGGHIPSGAAGPLVVYSQDTIAERVIVLAQGADGCVYAGESGRLLPFAWRSIPSPLPNTRIPGRLGATPPVAIVADIKVPLPWIRVAGLDAFTRLSAGLWVLLGSYVGVVAILLLVGVGFSVWQRGRLAPAYVFYLSTLLFYQLQVTGLGFAWLPFWPGPEHGRLMHVISLVLILPGVVTMVVAFLRPPPLIRILLIAGALVSSLALYFSYWSPDAYRIGALAVIGVLLLIVVLLFMRLRDGEPAVRWFAAGLAVMMMTGILQPIVVLSGGTWMNSAAAFAMPFGTLIEATLWLVAVASRLRRERQLLLQPLEYEATHDPLTGAHNRGHLLAAIQKALDLARSNPARSSGLLFIDLDGFKQINDSLGHAMGDRVLAVTARMLGELVPDHEVLGRCGGDEFVVLLGHRNHRSAALGAATTIVERFRDPLDVNGQSIAVRASVGVIEVTAACRDADQIVADADIALYVAKARGGARYEEFKPSMRVEAEHRADLRRELGRALEQDRIDVYYQPVFELTSLRPIGFEALLRWRHPREGLLEPGQFLRLVDETGLGAEIGGRVIDKVFEDIYLWQQGDRWQPGWHVSINLFRQQLADERVVTQLEAAFRRWPLDRVSIRVELAEALLATHYEMALKTLRNLRGGDVLAAIDDFGTGVSGLAVLRDLEVDTIKVDVSLIAGIANVSRSQDLVRGILALGREFGCRVVAEGVEAAEQQTTLQTLRCEYGQGFLLAEPMPPHTLSEWFALWQSNIPSISKSGGRRKVH